MKSMSLHGIPGRNRTANDALGEHCYIHLTTGTRYTRPRTNCESGASAVGARDTIVGHVLLCPFVH